jgi:hypothetical protein
MTTIRGRLEGLTLRAPNYIAVIERLDIDTVHQHRHIELRVAPSAVDTILALNGTLNPLLFTVKDGRIVNVTHV